MDWTERVGRRITPRDLHVFMAVAEARSMARASEQLAISRPVISKTISELEAVLGVRLLDRTPSGVEPTRYGEALLGGGRAVFDELRQTVQSITSMADPTAGSLRIGCTEVNGGGIVARVVERMCAQHPGIRFSIQSGSVQTRMELLRLRRVDLFVARMASVEPEPDVDYVPLTHERLAVVCGERNPLCTRRSVEIADLAECPWIASPLEIASGGPIHAAFARAGLRVPENTIVSDSLTFRYAVLARGPFVTVVPHPALEFGSPPPWVRVLPYSFEAWPMPTVVATLRGRTLTPPAKLFIDQAKALFADAV